MISDFQLVSVSMFPGNETPLGVDTKFSPGLPRRQAIHWLKVPTVGACVIEASLHFPTPDIKLAAGSTMETSPVGLTLVGKRPAHFLMPTTQHPRYPAADPAPRRNVL